MAEEGANKQNPSLPPTHCAYSNREKNGPRSLQEIRGSSCSTQFHSGCGEGLNTLRDTQTFPCLSHALRVFRLKVAFHMGKSLWPVSMTISTRNERLLLRGSRGKLRAKFANSSPWCVTYITPAALSREGEMSLARRAIFSSCNLFAWRERAKCWPKPWSR